MRTMAWKEENNEYENNEYQLAGGFALASAISSSDTLRRPLPPKPTVEE